MNNDNSGIISVGMINTLGQTQAEARRKKLNCITTIMVLKTMLYSRDSIIMSCLRNMGKSWEKIETAITKQESIAIKEENDTDVVNYKINLNETETIVINMDYEMYNNMLSALEHSPDGETVDEMSFVKAMITNENKYVYCFFNNINLSPKIIELCIEGIWYEKKEMEAEEQMEEEANSSDNVENSATSDAYEKINIPQELQDCLEIMYADTAEECLIKGRDKETNLLIRTLSKYKKSNAILVGKKGVGKTAIVESLVYKIGKGEVPNNLKEKVIVSFDVSSIIAGTMYRGQAEEKFNLLKKFLEEQKNVILFVDEIHTIIGAGRSSENSLDLSNSLKPLLARNGVSIIGATTDVEYEKYFAKDEAFRRRFETITVEEPIYDEVYPMVEAQVKNLSKIHRVKFSRQIIDFIIMTAPCFNFETHNPDLTLDLVDKAMATAKIEGKYRLTPEIVLSNFQANFALYSKMSEENKMATAFHEAGHYLARRYSKNLNIAKALAVSIIPTEEHLGVSVTDSCNLNIITWNYNAHIESIAISLAGRVAEEMYSKTLTSGASSDLNHATEEARNMVFKYGLAPNSINRIYVADILTENQRTELNNAIDDIIKEATNVAKSILREHEVTLKAIAEKLCEKGMLIRNELEKICNENEGKVAEKTKVFN